MKWEGFELLMTLPPIPVSTPSAAFGPWNPGIQSSIPRDLRHLCTIFRPENVFTDVARAEELRDLTGLDLSEVVAFRPERLVLHELLIRITADFSVSDGSKIEDLGINFRQIARAILAQYIEPQQNAITAHYDALRRRLADFIESELAALIPSPTASDTSLPRSPKHRFRALFARDRGNAVVADVGADAESRVISAWEAQGQGGDGLQQAAFRALARVASALLVRHGRVWGGRDMIATLAADIACNTYGSDEIGRMIEPLLRNAAAAERYVLLPRQERPVVINTKGPSASGKSTLRPLQKKLASDIGVDWQDIALISPDIWRKQLLDYGSLGSAFKYAGAFTGEEVQIVDHKLDRYMARKHRLGHMPHLLIDRFRFDSFAADSNEAGSNLLTRFGQTVYLFFVITPPESLVERAWKRGLEFGRYKAVDDTLAHSVEAYTGIPDVFFTWARRSDKRLQFEFLDNSVRFGDRPRTVAFGDNSTFNVLDVSGLLNIQRYGRINVGATNPQAVYPSPEVLAPEKNAAFLESCIGRFRSVNFADQGTGRIYLHIEEGRVEWMDGEPLRAACIEADVMESIKIVAPAALEAGARQIDAARYLSHLVVAPTLGEWGLGVSRRPRAACG